MDEQNNLAQRNQSNMNFYTLKRPLGLNGDINYSAPMSRSIGHDLFSGQENRNPSGKGDLAATTAIEPSNNQIEKSETFLCHHDCLEPISDNEIRIALACHSVQYVRALLCEISQIVFHLCRQAVIGRIGAAQLSGMIAAKLLPILDTVRYSCQWAEKQMKRWWGDEMSATTFRRVRSELESWGCFVVQKVKPGSTRQITPLHDVDLARMLQIAAMAFRRLRDEPDGRDRFIPSHGCGFLAALWSVFFPGSLYTEHDPANPLPTTLERLADKRSELSALESKISDFAWSASLVEGYRSAYTSLQAQISNLETFLAEEF
jgi:hypothetical protein